MGIESALAAINIYQAQIAITSPVVASITKVYETIPNEAGNIEPPCWINTWTLLDVAKMAGSGLVETQYDVRMQLFVYDADADRAASIANAFMDAALAKFVAHGSLGGAISHSILTGGSPTLVQYTWNKIRYIGLDLHLHIFIKTIMEVGF